VGLQPTDLIGGEHGARLRPVGARLILHATAEVFLTDHQRPPMRAILLASAQAATLRSLVSSNFTSQGSSLARLLHKTDIAPLTKSRCR
jgi:hypothetical protein